jgi:hypothetical protein
LLDTIAIFVPKSLFNIELLPTFGLPTIAIKADLSLVFINFSVLKN